MQANFYDGAIIGDREEQQDDRTNVVLSNGYILYVVADGMGGHRAGQLASKTVCAAFRDYFRSHPEIEEPQRSLRSALQHANQAIADVLTQQPELKGMGTTVVAVLLHTPSNSFSFISVGDSPLYQFHNGKLKRINANHAYYEQLKEAVQRGEMSAEEAKVHPERHAITSAVMGDVIHKFDLQNGTLLPNMLLLIASDGLQTLNDDSDGEISAILGDHFGNIETQVSTLLQAVVAKAKAHQDNTTVVLIKAVEGSQDVLDTLQRPTTEVELNKARTKSSGKKRWKWLLFVVIALVLFFWAVNPAVGFAPQVWQELKGMLS